MREHFYFGRGPPTMFQLVGVSEKDLSYGNGARCTAFAFYHPSFQRQQSQRCNLKPAQIVRNKADDECGPVFPANNQLIEITLIRPARTPSDG